MEAANEFLRKHYIAEFNSKFKVVPAVKETAFRRNTRADLDWVFTVQSERVVAKDNTVAIAERNWQLEKSRFRSSLAGCRVTIHEHLNGTVSVRYGPHEVGQYLADGTAEPVNKKTSKGRGKAGPVEAMENQKPVSQLRQAEEERRTK